MRISRTGNLMLVGGAAILLHASAAAAGVHGPVLPYESFSDSPLNGLSYSWFHLETYEEENAPQNSPGVTMTPGAVVVGPGVLVDSVDGGGNNGHSLFFDSGPVGLTFAFDMNILGSLPTHVGIAWTDGELNVHFTAFDQNGVSMGTIDDSSGHGFSQGDGDPDNYRLFWADNPGGISSIHISNDGGGIEVDHLQYGLVVPAPASLAPALPALALMLARRRRVA